jgi:hypothetical protein
MNVSCPVCKGEAREDFSGRRGDHNWINCQRCGGAFELGGKYYSLRQNQAEPLPLLAGVLRHAFERGETLPLLDSFSAEELTRRAPATAEGKAKRLLEAIARRAPHPGADVAILTHAVDYPLAYATGGVELRSYLGHISNLGWVEVKQADDSATRCTLTVAGLMVVEVNADAQG